MGKKSMKFPQDGMSGEEYMIRKKAKKTMKSTTSPYEPFEAFYPLEDIIDAYMEIWYQDDSDSSSS